LEAAPSRINPPKENDMAKTKTPRWNYPEPQARRSGIKVKWLYYASKEDAEKASKLARDEGEYWAARGYEYGYMSPGSIYPPGKQGFYPDLYEVCLP
jgi:hypothetical protein